MKRRSQRFFSQDYSGIYIRLALIRFRSNLNMNTLVVGQQSSSGESRGPLDYQTEIGKSRVAPRRKPVSRAAARKLNARAPVNSLPAELLYCIFRLLDEPALHCTPARVCGQWRATALAEARLWTRIYVRNWHALDAVPVLLDRSGTAPVDMQLRLYKTQAVGPDVPRCATALARHFAHIETLSITSFSLLEFRAVVGPALQCASPSLRALSLHIRSEASVARAAGPLNPNDQLAAVRSLAPIARPIPGGSMPALQSLVLDYPVTLKQLMKLLAHTPALEVLHVRQGVTENGLPSVPQAVDPSVQQLRLREFFCEHTEDWVRLFGNSLSLARVKRIAVIPAGSLEAAGPLLFADMGKICALALDGTRQARHIVLSDVRGRRRLLVTKGGLDAVLAQAGLPHDIECLSILAPRLSMTHGLVWNLQAVPLDRLHTIIYELQDVLVQGRLRAAELSRLVCRLTMQAVRLPPSLPALRDLVLIPRGRPEPIDVIEASSVLKILAYIMLGGTLGPRLRVRLVNVRLAENDDRLERQARAILSTRVSSITEEEWDEAMCRTWCGVPEYAFWSPAIALGTEVHE